MVSKVITITNATGLHARPASMFVQTAGKYKSKIEVVKGDARLNAKSIMGIMAISPREGMEVDIEADGQDENEAVAAMSDFLRCTRS